MGGIFKVGGAKIYRLPENNAEAARQAGLAALSAALAAHYATDNVNSDVPGGTVGDRGAKYWSGQAGASAANAATSLASLTAIAASSNFYPTKAAASTALSGLAANAFAHVLADETRGGRWTIYQKVSGAYVFVNYATPATSSWYVNPRTGSDSNPGTRAAPFASINKALSLAVAGDTVWTWPNSVIKYVANNGWDTAQAVADGVNIRCMGGGKTIWMGFDKFPGTWTGENSNASYYLNATHQFGGASALAGGGRIYPSLLYRSGAGADWKQLALYLPNDTTSGFTTAAQGIAYIQANPGASGACYVEDLAAGGSGYNPGWKQGSFRYHVNLPGGVDPTTCQWMIAQRQIPTFGFGHTIENQIFFGALNHDGLQCRGSKLIDIEIAYPGNHACEIPGCYTDGLTIRESRLRGYGPYAFHHFGLSANWNDQIFTWHRKPRLINWQSAMIGCHGVDSTDGGGGPGVVCGELVFEDLHAENVNAAGSTGAIFSGVTFLNPVMRNASFDFSGATFNITILNPKISVDRQRNDALAPQANPCIFCPPGAGYTMTVRGGQSVSHYGGPIRMGGGALDISAHRSVYPGSYAIFNVSSHQGLTVTRSLFQCDIEGNAGDAGGVGSVVNPSSGCPISFKESHFAGSSDLTGVAGVTVDTHSKFGGDGGLRHTYDPTNPIATADSSTWWTIGERILNVTSYFGRNMLACTSKGIFPFSGTSGNPSISTNMFPYPVGFIAAGAAAFPVANNNKVFCYGAGGQLWYNGNSGSYTPTWSQVTTGVTTNFVNHLADGSNLFLFGDDGTILKVNTASGNACSSVTSPIAAAGKKVRATLVVSTGASLLAVWDNDAQTAGGIIYSTDGGATWSSNTTSGLPAGFRCLALINGVIVASGEGGAFMTSTTVAGTFTQQSSIFPGGYNLVSIAADASKNYLLFVSRGVASASVGNRFGNHRAAFGYIDCSSGTIANWKFVLKPLPLPSPLLVAINTAAPLGNYASRDCCLLADGRQVARTMTSDGVDYLFDRGRNEPVAMDSPARLRLHDDLAYYLA